MIFLFLIFLIILMGVWAFFVEPNIIKIEKVEIELKEESILLGRNLIFIQLSDFHSKSFGYREKKVLKILRKVKPDFVFITGDIVDWQTKDFQTCGKFWQELAKIAPGKTFAVLGNHDHRNQKFREFLSLFEKSGIELLNNDSKKIFIDGGYFYLIGVDDPHLGYDNIEKAMEGVESEKLKILLAHSPEIFRKVKGKDINFVLTGHTHGGLVNLPFITDFILPLRYDKKYKRGLFQEQGTYLYVNRGIGTTILPIRFNSFPEITLFRFKKTKEK